MTLGDFCIRWVDQEVGPCVLCGGETGAGPVGWHQGNPIGVVCDECLLHAERGLGAALRTLNVIRGLAVDPAADLEAYEQMASRLMIWVYVYHRTESWPIRPIAVLDKRSRDDSVPSLLQIVGSNGDDGKVN